MKRRQELENIIIGTLLDSTKEHNYFVECRSCVTAGMFRDEANRRIFGLLSEMNAKGKENTDPCTIYETYGLMVADILPRMCELVADWSFVYKNWKYKEDIWLKNDLYGANLKANDVSFSDYVDWFIKLSLDEEEGSNIERRPSTAA